MIVIVVMSDAYFRSYLSSCGWDVVVASKSSLAALVNVPR